MTENPYDEDYFLHGRESGKSLYENYRWMPELTIPMCQAIAEHCSIIKGERVLDFGCARGYIVKALRGLEYDAYGVDISEWAINNADEAAKPYLNLAMPGDPIPCDFEWIIAKDVLEHVPYVDFTIGSLMNAATKGVFVVVPLGFGVNYVVPEYDKDATHIHRLSLSQWVEKFVRPGWSVEARYRLCGVKDNYAHWPKGNGFITCRRV